MSQATTDGFNKLRNQVITLLETAPDNNTLPLSAFFVQYRKRFGEFPNPQKYQVTKKSAVLELFPDICRIEKPRTGGEGTVELIKSNLKSIEDFGNQLKEILSSCVSGCGKSTLWKKYKAKFGQKPKPAEYGSKSLDDLLKLLPNIVEEYENKEGNVIVRLVSVRKKSPPEKETLSDAIKHQPKRVTSDIPRPENSPDISEKMKRSRRDERGSYYENNHDRQSSPAGGWEQMNYSMNYPPLSNMLMRGTPPMQAPPMQAPPMHAPLMPNHPHVIYSHNYNQANQQQPSRHRNDSYYGNDRKRQESGSRGQATKTQFVPKEEVVKVAKDCIERLAESKKYVSLERIEKLLLQHYNVSNLREMNIHQLEHIQSVNDHIRTQAKVTAYIQAFTKTRAIATLYELGEALKTFVANNKEFESLNLGPLTQQPLAYHVFKFPPEGTEVPEITTADILEYLRAFLTEKNQWTTKSELVDFMNYMMEKRGLETPYELGIRITSLPLAIQVLKRAQKDTGTAIRGAIFQLKEMAETDLTKAFDNFVRSVVDKEPGCCVVRREYHRMPTKQLIDVLFQKINVLFASVNYLQELHQVGKGQIREVHKTQDVLHQLLNRMRQDKLLQQLFQFAVCTSLEETHIQLHDILGLGTGASQGAGPSSGAVSTTDSKPRPQHHVLINQLKKYVERCNGALSLTNLSRIEQKLLEEFDFPHFSALANNSFLKIMAEDSEVKQYLEENGGGVSGGGSGSHTVYSPSLSDLLYFISQCSILDHTLIPHLEASLCYHYSCPDVKSLGHGSSMNLLQRLERNPSLGRDSCLLYESALVAKAGNGCLVQGRKSGVLGHQTKDKALSCLQNCPLLEDMHEWSHWDMVFEPELGDLRDFIQKYGNVHTVNFMDHGSKVQMTTSVLALETRPGTLLKITADTSPEKMATAALNADVRATCGHLVSLIVTNKGLENTGLVLLGNHVKTSIFKMQADQIPGGPCDGASTSAQFVLDCLTFLPRLVCVSVAQKVFLEPLSQVVGQTKSRDLLLKLSTTSATSGRLQLLGFMLGQEDWGQSFLQRVLPPSDCLQKLDTMAMDDVIMIDDDDDEEETMSSDEEDSDFILSDEEPEMTARKLPQNDTNVSLIALSDDSDDESDAAEVIESSTEAELMDKDDTVEVISDSTGDETLAQASSLTPPGKTTNPCLAVVNQIRKEEFGVDVILSEDGQKLMQKQQERLGRSLDRLSKDLYSKDTHFVLELIQNADDNDYPENMYSADSGACPSVKFVVEETAISVLNNECGFQEPNIRALCDVGRSTKGKHKLGYIGQKGIGFKSVFRVTDRPEIHSNGYHMCFDVNSGPTGYILPHWIEDEDSFEDNNRGSDRWTTRIVLPQKPSAVQTQTQTLAARFHDVHPSLLLFLHRLKCLTVVNMVENYTLKIQRQDMGDNIIDIRHNKAIDRWFVVRKTLDASKISTQAKSGVDVVSTEIAMAFPLQSLENVRAMIQPQKQPVFAFLPLRSYGFRFVIQGDFDVPSSREDVDRDSLWNQWLSSELHLLFSDALQQFKEHPSFMELEAVCRFLQFVPLEDEILDFFRPVATQIMKQLRALPCLPAYSTSKRLTWKLPSQLILSKDHLLMDVIPSSVLRDHLSLEYLHPDVAAVLNPTLMASLGVQRMSLTHLIEIRKVMLSKQPDQVTDELIADTAKWLTCVYRAMDEFDDNGDILEQVRKLCTIPLADSSMVALTEKSVFFPPEADQKPKRGKNLLLALYQDMNSVHPLLLHSQDAVANSQATNLLERLGVKRLTPHDILHHHILPVLRSNQWQEKPRDLLVAYIVYIKEQLDLNQSIVNMDELKNIAVVLTNHGPKKVSEVPVHFTPAYLNRIDLQKCLPGYPWVLLDACYLLGAQLQSHLQIWRDFFSKLGVIDFLAVKSTKVTLSPQQLVDSAWAGYKDMIPARDSYTLLDMRSEELEQLICNNTQPETQLQQLSDLFEMLDTLWDVLYSQKCIMTQLFDGEGRVLRDVDTSFSLVLKTLPWVPARVMSTGDGALTGETIKKMIPSMLFVPDKKIQRLLDRHVPYLSPRVSDRSSFAVFLGIRFKVGIDYVKQLLISWCVRRDEDNDEQQEFSTSLGHMKAVYRHLYDNLTPKELQDLTHDYPLVFVPDGFAMMDDEVTVSGRFLARREVRWSDPSGLFAKHRASLETLDHEGILKKPELIRLYGDMPDFFLKSMRIDAKPHLEDYIRLMLHISATTTGAKDSGDILRILTVVGQGIKEAQHNKDPMIDLTIRNIRELMANKKCLLEKHKHKWVGLEDKPMLADDSQLEKMFKDRPDVNFLDCGEKLRGNKSRRLQSDAAAINTDEIRFLYETIGIETLSSCVEVNSVTELYAPCPTLQKYVHDVISYVQRLLVTEYEEVYSQLKVKGVAAKLSSMAFGQVGKLELVYTLRNLPVETPVVQTEKCQINLDDGQFIVHRDHIEDHTEINIVMARAFSMADAHCFRQLKEVLNDLEKSLQSPNPDLQQLVDMHDLQTLPAEEEVWAVPEPVIVYEPPPPVYRHMSYESQASEEFGTPTPEGDQNKPTGLTAWPPNASMVAHKSRGIPSKSTTMWPPPKPPADMDRSQLPDNLRPSKYAAPHDGSQGDRPPGSSDQQGSRDHMSRGGTGDVNTSTHRGDGDTASNIQDNSQHVIQPHTDNTQSTEDTDMVDVDVDEVNPNDDQNTETDPSQTPSRPIPTANRQDSMVIEFGSSPGNQRYQQLRKRPRVDSGGVQDQRPGNEQMTKKPVYFYGPPVWTAEADDAMYEEMRGADLCVPDGARLDEGAEQHSIGIWGEELVKNYLEKLAEEPDSNIISIKWVNQENELWEPYDFIVTVADGDDFEKFRDIYIEVKSTLSGKKAFFEISSQQIQFAQEFCENYHLYRVFNAGKNEHVRLTKLENLAAMLNTKQVKLCMVV